MARAPAALTRRGFVLGAAAIGAAMWVPAGAARWLWSLLGGGHGGSRLGLAGVPGGLRDFVTAVAGPRPAGWQPPQLGAALERELLVELRRWWQAGAGAAADPRRAVAERVAADFAEWRVVIVDHFLLSRTEAALQLLADRLHAARPGGR